MENQKKINVPKTNAFLAVGTYGVLALGVLGYSFMTLNYSIGTIVTYFFIGILVFSLLEYGAHRFLYHSGDNYKKEGRWQYTIHGVHHVHPRDEGLLAMPIWLAVGLGAMFFLLFYLLLGEYAYFFWPGFFGGYAIYLYIHFLVHARKPPKNMFRYLWTHHAIHHYEQDNKAYGVSSPLWDIIFGTMPLRKQRKK